MRFANILVFFAIASGSMMNAQYSTSTLTDTFDRPDGAVGNGWSEATDNGQAKVRITNKKLTTDGSGAMAAIYRPVSSFGNITISADITPTSGFDTIRKRYGHDFLIGANTSSQSGYGIRISRSGEDYNNSTVSLIVNGQVVDQLPFTYQFQDQVHVDVEFDTNFVIRYHVLSGDWQESAVFVPGNLQPQGNNLMIVLPLPDTRTLGLTPVKSTLDNLTVSAVTEFSDNFNRANGDVANGWITQNGTYGANLIIEDNQLTVPYPGRGGAGIVRPVPTAPLTAKFTLRAASLGGGSQTPGRQVCYVYFDSYYTVDQGYGILIYRTDQNLEDSIVGLLENNVAVDLRHSTFQFGDTINVTVTYQADGSLDGNIEGGGSIFPFHFGPHPHPTGNTFQVDLEIGTGSERSVKPRLDNLSLSLDLPGFVPVPGQ